MLFQLPLPFPGSGNCLAPYPTAEFVLSSPQAPGPYRPSQLFPRGLTALHSSSVCCPSCGWASPLVLWTLTFPIYTSTQLPNKTLLLLIVGIFLLVIFTGLNYEKIYLTFKTNKQTSLDLPSPLCPDCILLLMATFLKSSHTHCLYTLSRLIPS